MNREFQPKKKSLFITKVEQSIIRNPCKSNEMQAKAPKGAIEAHEFLKHLVNVNPSNLSKEDVC